MNIKTKKVEPSGTQFLVNGKFAGLVSQSPEDPSVANAGKWDAVIQTSDGGSIGIGFFDTEEEAVQAGLAGLKKNLTFEEWQPKEV